MFIVPYVSLIPCKKFSNLGAHMNSSQIDLQIKYSDVHSCLLDYWFMGRRMEQKFVRIKKKHIRFTLHTCARAKWHQLEAVLNPATDCLVNSSLECATFAQLKKKKLHFRRTSGLIFQIFTSTPDDGHGNLKRKLFLQLLFVSNAIQRLSITASYLHWPK